MSANFQVHPKSKVPFHTFPTTLEEQETGTGRESAAAAAARLPRPATPGIRIARTTTTSIPRPASTTPTDCVSGRGAGNLFYQAYPPEDTRQHWGHAVSDDLIHWRDLPYCIYPSPEDKCFSGATLVEEDRVIAIYHGTEVGNMVATSSDPLLLNWEKVTNGPVIPMRQADGSPQPYRVFDPCIWKQGGRYYSLSAGNPPGSDPAANRSVPTSCCAPTTWPPWEYLHPFVEDDLYTLVGDDGACPYFWPIGNGDGQRHILLFYSHMSGGQYHCSATTTRSATSSW